MRVVENGEFVIIDASLAGPTVSPPVFPLEVLLGVVCELNIGLRLHILLRCILPISPYVPSLPTQL